MEGGGGQAFDQRFELEPVLPRRAQGEGRMVGAENLRQHAPAEARGERPLVRALVFGQLLALGERDGDAQFGLEQQAVLGEEASEQHAVPLLAGALLDQPVDGLPARARIAAVAELAGVDAQLAAQRALLRGHVRVGLALVDGQPFQRRARPALGNLAGVPGGPFEQASELGRKGVHGHRRRRTERPPLAKRNLDAGHRVPF